MIFVISIELDQSGRSTVVSASSSLSEALLVYYKVEEPFDYGTVNVYSCGRRIFRATYLDKDVTFEEVMKKL
ncbi:hypothetical protein [Erwinia phage FBB1]|nr:hypothetical protein [Erwinia phage FBB1]